MAFENVVVVHRMPWNKGKLTGQKPPSKLREISAIRTRLQMVPNTRELAMFNLAIDSKAGVRPYPVPGPGCPSRKPIDVESDSHAAEDPAADAV